MTDLTFDKATHTYGYRGEPVPNVTSIISPLQDFSQVDPAVLERARKFGQAVHLACELWDRGILDLTTLDPDLVPYLEGWQRFMRECSWVNDHIETMLYHPKHHYAGRLDRVGFLGTGTARNPKVRAILDIKTGTIIGPEIGVQLAAYREAHNLMHPEKRIPKSHRYSVRLIGNGKYKLDRWVGASDWTDFLKLLGEWKEKHGNGN